MRPSVYKIRASVAVYPEDCWREFEILSCSTVGQLGCAVLAAFEVQSKHSWYLWDGKCRYEYILPNEEDWVCFGMDRPTDPDFVRLDELKLTNKKELVLGYNFDSNWFFRVRLTSRRALENYENSYCFPEFIRGRGGRILDRLTPMEMLELLDAQKQGLDPKKVNPYLWLAPEESDWRYDEFNKNRLKLDFRDEAAKNEHVYRGYDDINWLYGYCS